MTKMKQSFIEVAEALKNDFYFISIDLPAHGKTAPLKKMPLTHMMHWENPELVINEVRDWFK
jgi:hypothetical protein